MQEPILRARSLCVGYGGQAVVRDISLIARPGRVLTVIGPNGAGKSTLLKTLIGHLPPLSGELTLHGQPLPGLSRQALARSVAAVLTVRLEPELMTCREVVAAGRYPYTGRLGILSPADREKVAQAMALVETADLADRDFNRLSDGQRQRVLLARAICQEPELLVLDEPTSFLDIRHKLEFLSLLRTLARDRNLAVILSLHELDLAQKCSDRLLCLRDGQVERRGTPEEIFSAGAMEALYGVERGSYNPLFGCVEPEPARGAPRVFVVGGGGSGIPVYRRLQRMGVPFAAGVLPENDLDTPVAGALAVTVVRERAFCPVSESAVQRAAEIAARCEWLICAVPEFGPGNRANQALVEAAARQGKLLDPADLDRLTTKNPNPSA